jgi:uncharacterized membrane protein
MMCFVTLGGLLVVFVILTAITSYRARRRAAMVGTSPEAIAVEKAEARARRQEMSLGPWRKLRIDVCPENGQGGQPLPPRGAAGPDLARRQGLLGGVD